MPEEGTVVFDPIVYEQKTVETCSIQGENVEIKCHTFLQVYIPSTTFGRRFNETSSVGKMLCDGAKPADNQAPQSSDCLEETVGLLEAQTLCHGHSTCSIPVAPDMATLGSTCSLLKKELRTRHICGELPSLKFKTPFQLNAFHGPVMLIHQTVLRLHSL